MHEVPAGKPDRAGGTLRPASYGDKPAVIMGESGEILTFAQLDERSMRLAQLLRRAGLAPGDHIAIIMENSARYFEIAWAAQRSGLYCTPINWHLSPAEAAYVLADCGAKAIFSSSAVGELAKVVAAESRAGLRLMSGGTVTGFESYEKAMAECPAEPLEDEIEGGIMCYSSGTTGRPKGVKRPLSHTPFGTGTVADQTLGAQFPFDERTVYLSPGPLYHAAPIHWSLAAQRFGGTVVVMEKFDPTLALELVQRHRVTMAQFVPTMFVRMLKLPQAERDRYDLSSLQFAIHAAAPCPVWVKEQMMAWWGPIIHEFFGATEGGLIVIGPKEWMDHKGSVGKPSGCRVHVLGDDGEELPAGESGTLYLEGQGGAFEYHNDPAKTAETINERGWMTLGDVGYLDADGYLFLTDRKSHMIISGGVNIYPQEVENLLLRHPRVADAAVIGVPNEEYGEEVKAVVQVSGGDKDHAGLAEELIGYCRANLAHFKCPRTIDSVDALPRLENGKLLKRLLKDQYWRGRAARS